MKEKTNLSLSPATKKTLSQIKTYLDLDSISHTVEYLAESKAIDLNLPKIVIVSENYEIESVDPRRDGPECPRGYLHRERFRVSRILRDGTREEVGTGEYLGSTERGEPKIELD